VARCSAVSAPTGPEQQGITVRPPSKEHTNAFDFASRFAASQRWADPLAERLQPLIKRAVSAPPVRNFLDGVWLGAPLHPGLTDVPVGAWTTALLLDSGSVLTRDRALCAAADRALAVGTIAAPPAAVTGLNDMRDLMGQSRRIAMVHALVNLLGLSLSTASLAYRHKGRRGLARGLSALGYLTSSGASRSCPCSMRPSCRATSFAKWRSTACRYCSPAPALASCARSPAPAPIWEKKFGLEMNSVRGRTSPGPSESMPVHLKKSDQATVAADGRPNPQPPLAPVRDDGAGRRRS
jgi:hypothetical protein